jgi:hypothetical protein
VAQYQIDNVPFTIDFQESDIKARTLQNAKNLLMCRMGEVPYDRLRGFDYSIFDRPVEEWEDELLPELDRVMEWEPDIEVVDAEASLLKDGSAYIKVIVETTVGEDEESDEYDDEGG